MTTFVDGPAKGQTLMLKRAPLLLRVTQEGDKWDALDQLEDQPRSTETLHAYELACRPGSCFVDGSKIHGRFTVAHYKLVIPQPAETVMRSNAAWAEWANTVGPEKAKLLTTKSAS